MGGNNNSSPVGPWMVSRNGFTFNSYFKLGQVQKPSGKFVFGEEAQSSLDDGEFAMYPLVPATPINIWWNLPNTRHNVGSTWSFVDGHVELYRWRGTVIAQNQNNHTPNAIGHNGDFADSSPLDLPRGEAGGATYP